MYWLTRVVWSFRSRLEAAISAGLVLGGLFAATTALGLIPPGGETRSDELLATAAGFVIGGLAGSISVWVVRGRWPNGESLSRDERDSVLRCVHLGQDVQNRALAAATRDLAAAERSRVEHGWNRLPLIAFVAIQTVFMTITLLSRGRWLGATAVLLVTISLAACSWWIYRSRPLRCRHAWEAEWYAAQRLGPSA